MIAAGLCSGTARLLWKLTDRGPFSGRRCEFTRASGTAGPSGPDIGSRAPSQRTPGYATLPARGRQRPSSCFERGCVAMGGLGDSRFAFVISIPFMGDFTPA